MSKNQDAKMASADFAAEVAKILPMIMREFAKRQQDLFSKVFLTIPQIVILEFLVEKGPCKMNELARALNFTMSAVTAIVDKMVRLKLVKRERSVEDRRVVKVTLLDKGTQMSQRIKETRHTCVDELFSALTQEDKSEYIRILKKVYANLTLGKR